MCRITGSLTDHTHARRASQAFSIQRIVHSRSTELLEYTLKYPATVAHSSRSRELPKKREPLAMLYHYCLVLRLSSALSRGKLNPLEHKTLLQWSHHYLIDSTGFQNYSLLNRFSSCRNIGWGDDQGRPRWSRALVNNARLSGDSSLRRRTAPWISGQWSSLSQRQSGGTRRRLKTSTTSAASSSTRPSSQFGAADVKTFSS